MTHASALPTHSIYVGEFHFDSATFAHHPIHPNQIPRERVQATQHEPNAVNETLPSSDY